MVTSWRGNAFALCKGNPESTGDECHHHPHPHPQHPHPTPYTHKGQVIRSFSVFFDATRISCWPNSPVAGDLRLREAHITSLSWDNVKCWWAQAAIRQFFIEYCIIVHGGNARMGCNLRQVIWIATQKPGIFKDCWDQTQWLFPHCSLNERPFEKLLRARTLYLWIKYTHFRVWIKFFKWNLKGQLWNSTQNIVTHTLRGAILCKAGILRARTTFRTQTRYGCKSISFRLNTWWHCKRLVQWTVSHFGKIVSIHWD